MGFLKSFGAGTALVTVFLLGPSLCWGLQCVDFFTTPHQESEIIQSILNDFEFPEEYNRKTTNRDLRLALYNAFGGRDFFSGQKLDYQEMSIDHVIPRSKGGANNIYNYVPTTQRLNGAKADLFDEIASLGVLSIIRTVYAEKVIRELNILANLPEETKAVMHKSNDPRRININEQGQILERQTQYKSIRLIASPTSEFQKFFTLLRSALKNHPDSAKIIGPSVAVSLTRILKSFSLEDIQQFKRMSDVKTEIFYSDEQTQTAKTYSLIQSINTHKNGSENPELLITRKLYERLLEMSKRDFRHFLHTGILVKNER